MKRKSKSVLFDVKWGTLEIRLCNGNVTGHFMSHDRRSYQNTSTLYVDGDFNLDAIDDLLRLSEGDIRPKDKDTIVLAILDLTREERQ